MKKDSVIDYLSCILFRVFSFLARLFPKGFSLFWGRRLGDLLYFFDPRHRAIAYANIKTAFKGEFSPRELTGITRGFYRAFGQNLVEIFFIPLVNKAYMDKYISIEGLGHIYEGFKKGKGVILLGIHEGSWELSNIICANIGFPFVLFVRDQRYPRLDKLLNSYRIKKGCRIIQRDYGLKELVMALKKNQAVGMTADQGGRSGILVRFFGREASMSTGAVKLALKYGVSIIPAFYTRLNGPYIKIILEPAFEIKKTGDINRDIRDNLQRVTATFERHIRQYPKEYLWTYKIWKYGKERSILVLSDGKTGHLRQAQALAKTTAAYLRQNGIDSSIEEIEVGFKNRFFSRCLSLSAGLAGRYNCQGCLWCLRRSLKKDVYRSLAMKKPDIIVSCGASVAGVNFILSRENVAKSMVILRPSFLSTRRFDLVAMPEHDNPPKRNNVVITEGALNLVDEEYLKESKERLLSRLTEGQGASSLAPESRPCIGFLIGGNTKGFSLKAKIIQEVIRQIKSAAEKLDAHILVTTSRRTPRYIEAIVKREFEGYPRCSLLIVANESNIPGAIGGILAFSQVVVVSPESVSMISEAAGAGRYIITFDAEVNFRHCMFLNNMVKKGYLYLSSASGISWLIHKLYKERPSIKTLEDRKKLTEALAKCGIC